VVGSCEYGDELVSHSVSFKESRLKYYQSVTETLKFNEESQTSGR
jgi:hypothetical protein